MSNTSLYNIKKLAIEISGVMQVRDASGEVQYAEDGVTPLTITLHSPGSKQFQRAKHANEERASTRATARMMGKETRLTAEEKIAERAEMLAACTISFDGFGIEGKTGHELFKAVYNDIELGHIADDVDKFLGERGNFKKQPTAA